MDLSDKDSELCNTHLSEPTDVVFIVFWVLDEVIHTCFITAVSAAKIGLASGWEMHKKTSMMGGKIPASNKGIGIDWKDPTDENSKPVA